MRVMRMRVWVGVSEPPGVSEGEKVLCIFFSGQFVTKRWVACGSIRLFFQFILLRHDEATL